MTPLVVFSAKYLIFIIAFIAMLCVWRKQNFRARLFLVALVALPVGYALARFAGLFFSHLQPFAAEGFEPLFPHAADNSFPSDHMTAAAALATVGWFADRRDGLALWVLALLVGAARVFAGIHYWNDILAGALIGWFASYAAYFAVSKLLERPTV